jgi:hypothetical protein
VAKEGIRRFLVTSLGAVRIETGAVESESALVESTSFGALAKGFSLPKMIDLLGSLANQKAPRLATPIDQYLIFAAFDTLLDESNSAWSPALDQTVKKVVGGNATPLTLRELIEAHLFEFSAIDLEQGDEDEELRDLARLVARGGGQNGLVLGQFGGRFEQLTLHLHPTFVALAKAVEERKVWLETEMKLLDSRLAFLRTKKRELQSNPPASLIEQQKNARAIALIDIELEFLVDTAQPSLNNFSVIAQARMELLPRQIWKLQHAEKTGKEALLADFKRYESFTTKELLDQGAAGAALLAASEAYKDIITGTYWTWLRNKIVFASSPERTPKWNEFYEAVLKMEAGG